jgi:biotin carboxyl carrier protein
MSATSSSPAVAISIGQESAPSIEAAVHPAAQRRAATGDSPAAGTGPRLSPAQLADTERWLGWQCQMIAGVHRGAVFVVPQEQGEQPVPVAIWPDTSRVTGVLHGLAAKAAQARRGLIQKFLDDEDGRGEVCDYVAYPLINEGRATGVAVLEIEIRSEEQRQAVLQLVEWGAAWLENTLVQTAGRDQEAAELALRAMAPLALDTPLPVAANRLCTFLADRLGCARVALGLTAGMQVQIKGVSHQVNFDRRVAGVNRLEAAMEECVDQDQPINLPTTGGEERGLTHAHARLMEDAGVGAICSVPLRVNGDVRGALTFTWEHAGSLDTATARLLDAVAHDLAPVVDLKRRESRSGWRRLQHDCAETSRRFFGSGHLRAKLIGAAVVLALLAASIVPTDRRVSARSLIEGTVQQAVVAPQAGYLSAAHVRAGDTVEQGQVMAVLDDRELLLEREKWASERDKHAKEYQEALASRDRAKVSMASAQMAQAGAQLKLVDEQLERIKLRAPFSGTVVSGDLSRALGAPLERGQLLFEVVPDDGFRVSLQVDEHDVAGLHTGQVGGLRLAGLPDTSIAFEITRIVPVAAAEQGANHFRVEAALTQAPDSLRPGMQGVAKVVVGRGSLLTAWTAELIARLRLWAWSIGF